MRKRVPEDTFSLRWELATGLGLVDVVARRRKQAADA
jgi:hypothetical protein